MNLTTDTLVADRFRLVSPLGEGGMGCVWLAHHLRLDIPCAIKFISAEAALLPATRSRFDREARAAAQIQSPHVVQIFDCGVWEDHPYIAMELLKGEDLSARLEKKGRLSPNETYVILGDVCKALAKAHEVNLVHRDLKPGNIFLVQGDDREIAKVLDFGIAKDLSAPKDSNTKTGALLGTPYYMSPEQARGGREVDHRTDLWAVGVLAYQCVTGRVPFDADGLGELLMKIMIEPAIPPSQIADVPAGFDGFWERASARDPEQRFQSAKELAAALDYALRFGTNTDHGLGTPPIPGAPHPSNRPFQANTAPEAHATTTPDLRRTTGARNGSLGGGRDQASTPLQQSLDVPLPPKSSLTPIWLFLTGSLVVGAAIFFGLRSTRSTDPAATPPASSPVASAVSPPPAPSIAAPVTSVSAAPTVAAIAAPAAATGPAATSSVASGASTAGDGHPAKPAAAGGTKRSATPSTPRPPPNTHGGMF